MLIPFLFKCTATTAIYTLSLHDALPICAAGRGGDADPGEAAGAAAQGRARQDAAARGPRPQDRKSTRLNSSHMSISYAVFCLKKKKPPFFSSSAINWPVFPSPTILSYTT